MFISCLFSNCHVSPNAKCIGQIIFDKNHTQKEAQCAQDTQKQLKELIYFTACNCYLKILLNCSCKKETEIKEIYCSVQNLERSNWKYICVHFCLIKLFEKWRMMLFLIACAWLWDVIIDCCDEKPFVLERKTLVDAFVCLSINNPQLLGCIVRVCIKTPVINSHRDMKPLQIAPNRRFELVFRWNLIIVEQICIFSHWLKIFSRRRTFIKLIKWRQVVWFGMTPPETFEIFSNRHNSDQTHRFTFRKFPDCIFCCSPGILQSIISTLVNFFSNLCDSASA